MQILGEPLNAGDVIKCAHCGDALYRANSTKHVGDFVQPIDFKQMHIFDLSRFFHCPLCREPWIDPQTGRIGLLVKGRKND